MGFHTRARTSKKCKKKNCCLDRSLALLNNGNQWMAKRHLLFLVCLLLTFSPGVSTASPTDPVEFYKTTVRPLLAERCYTCHTDARMAGLRVDVREALLRGGQSGPAIVPGRADESLLIRAVSHSHERLKMPPDGRLSDEQIESLRTWITDGAHFDIDSTAPSPETAPSDPVWTAEQRAFWAFQPVRTATVPAVRNRAWPSLAIDYFVLSKLEAKGMLPAPPADKRTLLRRVTYDLIGLPPSPEEYEAFFNEESPEAFEKVVERLLDSPLYGERWGRHWLDVARYAEEDAMGLGPEPFPNSFRYRDWVVAAFNQDMPYDLFVKAQIAGDLLEGESETKLKPGLGLLGLGPWYYKIVEPPKARADELHDRIDVLSRGFLGLTVACARCHDHKYDPISTRDYYALGGVLTSTEYKEYPLAEPDVVAAYDKHKQKIDDLEKAATQLLEDEAKTLGLRLAKESARYLFAAWRVASARGTAEAIARHENLDKETLERWGVYMNSPKEHFYLDWWNELGHDDDPAKVRLHAERFQAFVDDLVQEQKEIEEYNRRVIEEHKKSTDPYDLFCVGCNAVTKALERDKYMLWTELFEAKMATNGKDKKRGVLFYSDESIERFLLDKTKADLEEKRSELESLKKSLPERYPFLHIIADKKDPQDMRRHVRGDPYSLGEVVPRRFLSIFGDKGRFQQGSGRLRLAGQIASAENPLTARVLVNRVWHHHFGHGLVRSLGNFGQVGDRPSHPELLDYLAGRFIDSGWSVKQLHREILLSSTYRMSSKHSERNFQADPENRWLWRANRRRLDVEALRDSMLFVTAELDVTEGGPAFKWEDGAKRRTLYGTVSRYRLERLLALFDFPDPAATADLREVTNTPLQRLFFLNSELITDRSRALVARLAKEAGDDPEARIRRAYRLLFGRSPGAEELQLAQGFLAEMNGQQPWRQLAQVLLSSNEFVFVD